MCVLPFREPFFDFLVIVMGSQGAAVLAAVQSVSDGHVLQGVSDRHVPYDLTLALAMM